MNYNPRMGFHEQDYHLIKTSLSKRNNQKEVLRYLTNVLPNPTDVVTLDNAQNTVKSVKAQLANKNLLPFPYFHSSISTAGIAYTVNSDGTITANGTATGRSEFVLSANKTNWMSGNYVLSGCPLGGSKDTYFLQTINGYVDTGSGIKVNNTAELKRISIIIKKGTTVSNLVFKPQLELGTTPTAYTPYISDFTTVNVIRYGTVETDSPQKYTPTATGEVTGITVLTPTTNIINDKGLLFTKVIGDDFNYIN